MVDELQQETQKFELIKFLFQEPSVVQPTTQAVASQPGTSRTIKVPIRFLSFRTRFQSFVNQISSYLHSSVKEGFFTNFFLGSFSTLLDTEFNKELNIKSLYYGFDNQRNLKIVARVGKDKIDEVKIFVFSEIQKDSPTEKNPEFTKNEWDTLKVKYCKELGKIEEPTFTLIKIDKDIKEKEDVEKKDNEPVSKVTVSVESDKILGQDNIFPHSVESFIEIKKQLGDSEYLEHYISKFSDPDGEKIKPLFERILTYIKNVHTSLAVPSDAYAAGAREASQHGFVAGIFDNFRYHYNARIYLEKFLGRGYSDIILLVRGSDRGVSAIPIVIELKAGTSGKEITAEAAFNQVKRYTNGCQLKKMRVLTTAKDILCVGLNLDLSDPFKTDIVSIDNRGNVPLIENILTGSDDFSEKRISEEDLRNQIKTCIKHEYYSFPPTPEKSDTYYFSRFLLGQSVLLDRILDTKFKKHIFIPKDAQRKLRSQSDNNLIVGLKSGFTSIIFIPTDNKPSILINIIEVNKDEDSDAAKRVLDEKINVPLDSNKLNGELKDKKIIEINLKFDFRKGDKKDFEKCFSVDVNEPINLQDYSLRPAKKFSSEAHEIFYPDQLKKAFDDILKAQKDVQVGVQDKKLSKLQEDFKELFFKVGNGIYPFKSLVKKEAHFQAVLHGIFDHYSDLKSKEGIRELVLTEFQTGAGDRIDMMIQIIDLSTQDFNKYKEFMPVGLELKYATKELTLDQKTKLIEQMNRYSNDAAIKAITDGRQVAVIGVVFFSNADDGNSLILTYEDARKTIPDLVPHSSTLITEQAISGPFVQAHSANRSHSAPGGSEEYSKRKATTSPKRPSTAPKIDKKSRTENVGPSQEPTTLTQPIENLNITDSDMDTADAPVSSTIQSVSSFEDQPHGGGGSGSETSPYLNFSTENMYFSQGLMNKRQ